MDYTLGESVRLPIQAVVDVLYRGHYWMHMAYRVPWAEYDSRQLHDEVLSVIEEGVPWIGIMVVPDDVPTDDRDLPGSVRPPDHARGATGELSLDEL